MMIAEHNARMERDENYREYMFDLERSYYESLEDEIERERELELITDWFSDRRIAADGTEEFLCDLCGKYNDRDAAHSECADWEQAWTDAGRDNLPF